MRVLERLGERHHIALTERRFAGRFGRGALAPDPERPVAPACEVALLAPETFMNRSGAATAAACAGLGLDDPARDLLVVLDDVDLPFGRLRLRPAGGAGGHRGLADVIERLATRDFPRLRVGVGRPPEGGDTADHVLEAFSSAERARLPALLDRAALALERALRVGVAAAMNEFNRDPDVAEPEHG